MESYDIYDLSGKAAYGRIHCRVGQLVGRVLPRQGVSAAQHCCIVQASPRSLSLGRDSIVPDQSRIDSCQAWLSVLSYSFREADIADDEVNT